MLKRAIKSAVDTLLPSVTYRRFLRRHTAGEIELALLPLLCPTGALALDIGANRGLYIHHLLRRTDRLVAFEPLPPMRALLRRIYGEDLRVEPVALSVEPGSATLRYPRANFSWATMEAENRLEKATEEIVTVEVEVRTLDSYGFAPAFVKIDVEGHEEAVIEGGLETLRRHRPAVLVEVEERHRRDSVGRIRERLEGIGHAGFYVKAGTLRPIATLDLARDQDERNVGEAGKVGTYVNNFIYVPNDAADALVAGAGALLAKPVAV